MDTYITTHNPIQPVNIPAPITELAQWFSVSGDMDDFIYFGEEIKTSER